MAQIPYAIEARDSARDGALATGLTPRWLSLRTLAPGGARPLDPPALADMGDGTYTYWLDPVATGHSLGVVDLGAALTSPGDRYQVRAHYPTDAPAGAGTLDPQEIARVVADLIAARLAPGTPTPTPTPTGALVELLGSDTKTGGDWQKGYGADGYLLAPDPPGGGALPADATVDVVYAQGTVWAGTTADKRALRTPSGDRLAACWFTGSTFGIRLGISDGQPHRIALYCLDWDGLVRSQRIEVRDSSDQVHDSRELTDFGAGVYLAWTIRGNVTLRITNTGPSNAVVSGLFFGGAAKTGSLS
jgi:hypothetical protein